MTIARYSEEHIPAVKEFNGRLRAAGAPQDYVFSENPVSRWLPAKEGAPVYNEFFLAVEQGAVRGAYALKHQEFWFSGERSAPVYYHHPFSEGIIDKQYTQVGLQMLLQAMRDHPLLFALGMAGYDRPLPRMLMALRWNHCRIPFFFRVNHPARFLRNIGPLRRSAARRLAADLGAFSGVGWLALKSSHAFMGFRGMQTRGKFEIVKEFGDWADELWRECAAAYRMIAVRDGRSLQTLYPASNEKFARLKVSLGGRTIGWAVTAEMQKRGHEEYGDLRTGTVLDALSRPEDATAVTAAAARFLLDGGVDVVMSNQSHFAWRRALSRCGFLQGPSNFIFAASRKLSEKLQPFQDAVGHSHLNRGDGDNLLQYA